MGEVDPGGKTTDVWDPDLGPGGGNRVTKTEHAFLGLTVRMRGRSARSRDEGGVDVVVVVVVVVVMEEERRLEFRAGRGGRSDRHDRAVEVVFVVGLRDVDRAKQIHPADGRGRLAWVSCKSSQASRCPGRGRVSKQLRVCVQIEAEAPRAVDSSGKGGVFDEKRSWR